MNNLIEMAFATPRFHSISFLLIVVSLQQALASAAPHHQVENPSGECRSDDGY